MSQPAVAYVLKKMGDLLVDEAIFLYNVPDKFDQVKRELTRMEAFLKDADSKQKRDERVKNWVNEIRDVARHVEDLVDTFFLKARQRRRHKSKLFCLNDRHVLGMEIDRILGQIREISVSRATYGIENLGGDADGGEVDESLQNIRRIYPYANDEADNVGLEDEKRKILKKLFDKSVKRRRVISIVGMGGLGKSTLAKKVFKHTEIKSRFDCSVWINVSQKYNTIDLLRDLLKGVSRMPKEELASMDRGNLEEKLHNDLSGKCYLIVMDDIWNDDFWNIVNKPLPDSSNGSRVLITTRFESVARTADPGTEPFQLRFLDEEESWELLSKKAYPYEDAEVACPEGLKHVGKQIAKKCGGLPLALVVLGGLLSKKDKTPTVWRRVAESINWEQSKEGQQCLEILALSYNELPHHLKWCFLYLASFPEDFVIDVRKLVRLWVAEGFVKHEEGPGGSMEEDAGHYLEELIQRCMVQVEKRNWDGSAEKCRIHDLLHDLCIKEAKEVGFLECQRNPPPDTVHRLSIHTDAETYFSRKYSTPNLRTLLGFNLQSGYMDLIPLNRLKLLRVVDIEGAQVRRLPKEIGDMVHLRYLGLRNTTLEIIPSSIGNLHYLQVLDMKHTGITKVPSGVWKIRTLRHMYLPRILENAPHIVVGRSSELRTLDMPIAGRWIDNNLSSLTKLESLGIYGILESHMAGLSNSLEKMPRLNALELVGNLIPANALTLSSDRLSVLSLFGQIERPPIPYESQQLPRNLNKLELYMSKLQQDPLALTENLQWLRSLTLSRQAFQGKEMVCSAIGFPQLQELQLEDLEELEEWKVEDGAMPRLVKLKINSCKKLVMLPEGLPCTTSLQEFRLEDMPDEFYARVQKEVGVDWHKIKHSSSITINRMTVKQDDDFDYGSSGSDLDQQYYDFDEGSFGFDSDQQYYDFDNRFRSDLDLGKYCSSSSSRRV